MDLSRKALGFALFGALMLALALGCQPTTENMEALEEVAEEPREVAGEKVTVEGRVSLVFGDCAFELEDEDPVTPERVLTLCEPAAPGATAPEVPADVAVGDWLRVTGAAGEMTREDYEFKSTLTLPAEVFGDKTTRSVILIEKAEKIPPPQPNEARLPKGPVVVPIL